MSEYGTFPIEIMVYGDAQPAGSKQAFVPLHPKTKQPYRRKGGGIVVNVKDDNPKAKGWKEAVHNAAQIQYLGPQLRGPLNVEFVFYRKRNKGDYGTGRNAEIVKDSADAYPMKKPDVLKLSRAVEDALTGVVWIDDAQIVNEFIGKRYDDKARVEVRVWPAEHATVADLVRDGVVEPAAPQEQFEQLALVAA